MFYEENQVSMFDPDTWCGKTSPEPSAVTEDKTSQRSSKKRSVSQTRKPPLFLCLRRDGQQAAYMQMNAADGVWLGAYSTHSFGESPTTTMTEQSEGQVHHNGVGASRLSQILEVSPHPRYSLSAKACQGILNRANKRGKKLPELLEKALLAQSLASSRSEEDVPVEGKAH